MASLALLVSLIFLSVILLGPATFLLSKSRFIPSFIIWIMGVLSIVIGIWWFLILPFTIIGLFGLLTTYLGWLAIQSKDRRA
ncbi:hypothetical protein EB001_24365 [bacterium]|jgi:hypothetical protein|nr:hypothetical protein [bacterium]